MTSKKYRRDPFRFDPLALFANYGKVEKVSLTSPDAKDNFLLKTWESIERALKNPPFVHGHRTQWMFEALVKSLGVVKLVKVEDAGDFYSSDHFITPPDYRIVLNNGSQLLIEVKNYHQGVKKALSPFRIKDQYLDSLLAYSRLMKTELKIAVYWASWNQWTLFSPDVMKRDRQFWTISFLDAKTFDEMYLLGDFMIGTTPPLALRILVDKTLPRKVGDDGLVRFTTAGLEVLCAGKKLKHYGEVWTAFNLMLYGNWTDYGNDARVVEGEAEWFEYSCSKGDEDDQGFQFVGSLSSMFASYYANETTDEEALKGLKMDVEPGWLKHFVSGKPHPDFEPECLEWSLPPSHLVHRLPLWIMQMRPKERPTVEASKESSIKRNEREEKE
jgi:hypothetical protein